MVGTNLKPGDRVLITTLDPITSETGTIVEHCPDHEGYIVKPDDQDHGRLDHLLRRYRAVAARLA